MSPFFRNFSFIAMAFFTSCSREIAEPPEPAAQPLSHVVLAKEGTNEYAALYLDDVKHPIDPNGPLTAVFKPAHQGDFIPAHEAATVIQWNDMMNYTKTDPAEDTILIYGSNKTLITKYLLQKSPQNNAPYFKGKSVNQINQETAEQTAARANAFMKKEIQIR